MGRRTHVPVRVGIPGLVVALLIGLGVTAGTGVSASADPGGSLTAELASEARAVSDPGSPRYRHFETPGEVAKYLAGVGLPRGERAAAGDGGGGHLMHSMRLGAGGLEGRCSEYYGELVAKGYPGVGGKSPFAVCGYTPRQLRSAYDSDGATGRGVTVAVLDAYGSATGLADADTYARRHGDRAFGAGQYTQKVDPAAWQLQDVCGGVGSWAAEQALDVEAVHALAPEARVLYYGANSCQDSDLLAALADIVGHRLADVVTASWGGPVHSVYGDEPAGVMAQYDRLFQVAALEGITVDFSSGDCGANAPTSRCGGPDGEGSSRPQATFPAADPWVTAVGGTSTAIARDGEIAWETPWGTRAWQLKGAGWDPIGWVYGGGGGTSADFAEPWYQVGRVPRRLSGTLLTGAPAASPRRTMPDLALDADPFTGMLVGQTQPSPVGAISNGDNGDDSPVYMESAVGGTSLACPVLAALEADAIQTDGGRALGFLNPSLYARAHTTLYTDVDTALAHGRTASMVFPPTPGKAAKAAVLALLGDDGPLVAAPGYDAATGLGAPGDDFALRLGGV